MMNFKLGKTINTNIMSKLCVCASVCTCMCVCIYIYDDYFLSRVHLFYSNVTKVQKALLLKE